MAVELVLFWFRDQLRGFFTQSEVPAIHVSLCAKSNCPGGQGICFQGAGGKTLPTPGNKDWRPTETVPSSSKAEESQLLG